MTEIFDRLMRETFGPPRRLTLDEQRDRILARGCAVCGSKGTLWQESYTTPAYCPDHEPEEPGRG